MTHLRILFVTIAVTLLPYNLGHEEWMNSCISASYCHASRIAPDTYQSLIGLKLAQVNVIVRHGDRTPVAHLLNRDIWGSFVDEDTRRWLDQESFLDFETNMPGMLTFIGEKQHVLLGETLTDVYVDRLQLRAQDVYVKSTLFPRTIVSARSLLKGLFPSSYTTIPINVQHSSLILPENSPCPRLRQLFNRIKAQSSYRMLHRQMESLQQQVEELLHLPKNEAFSFFDITDNFFCGACHDLSLDRTIGQAEKYCEYGRRAFRYVLEEASIDKELLRLQSGPLLREICTDLKAALFSVQASKKLNILSAHDTTIAYLNSALQTGQYHWPPYAANFIIELWTDDGDSSPIWAEQYNVTRAFVRIIYNGDIIKLPWCMADERSEGLCPIPTFFRFTKQLLPQDYYSECQPRGEDIS